MKKNNRDFQIKLKAAVIVQYRQRVLLIRELNNRTKQYRWNVIKGTFEPSKDRDIMATAIREAYEEARARIVLRHLLGIYYLRDQQDSITTFTFLADLVSSKVGLASKEQQARYRMGEDIIEIKFFTRDELQKLQLKDFVGKRGFLAIQDYLNGKKYPLLILQTLPQKR